MYKINVYSILRDHVRTLRVSGKEQLSVTDILVFFGVPAICSSYITCEGLLPKDGFVDQLLAACAIIFGFLLNMQALALGLEARNTKLEKEFLSEISSNIAFAVLVSFLSVVLLVFLKAFDDGIVFATLFYVLTYLLFVLALTIVMVFKRMHSAIGNELK